MLKRSAPFVLAALLGCNPGAPPSPGPTLFDGPRGLNTPPLPRELPGYAIRDTFVFEEPNSGVEYRYGRDDGFQADVFLYPLVPQGYLCLGRCAEEAAIATIESFKASFPLFIERGYADSMVAVEDSPVSVPRGSWLHRGRHLALRMVRQAQPLESHLYAFAGRESVLKVRVSYASGAFRPATVDSFVSVLLPAVAPPYTCALGLASEPGITISTTQARSPTAMVQSLDSLLRTGPYPLDYRAPNEGRWRTAPTFQTVGDSTDPSPSPGVTLFAFVSATKDSTRVDLTTQNACRLPPSLKRGSTSSVAGMIVGLRLMAALDSALKVSQ